MLRSVILIAALCLPAPSQTAPCAAFNDVGTPSQNLTAFGFAGPNRFAYQISSGAGLLALGARTLTENTFVDGFMTLEIYDHDATANAPGNRIAGGTWAVDSSQSLGWQGANFDAPVVMLPGTLYWVVWTETGFSRIPDNPAGTPLPTLRGSGGSWTSATSTAFMLRLYCSLLDGQNVTVAGSPCTTSTGLPTVFTNQAPSVGNSAFTIEASGLPPGAFAWMVMGLDPSFPATPLPVAGADPQCFVYTDGALATLVATVGTGDVRSSAASGHVIWNRSIPSDPGLVGLFADAQVATLDPNSAFAVPIVTTNAIQLILF